MAGAAKKTAAPKTKEKDEDKTSTTTTPETTSESSSNGSKRKTLSADERVAKLEAELAEARRKANDRKVKALAALYARRRAVQAKIDNLTTTLNQVEDEVERIESDSDPETVELAKAQDDAVAEAEAAAAKATEDALTKANDATVYDTSAQSRAAGVS